MSLASAALLCTIASAARPPRAVGRRSALGRFVGRRPALGAAALALGAPRQATADPPKINTDRVAIPGAPAPARVSGLVLKNGLRYEDTKTGPGPEPRWGQVLKVAYTCYTRADAVAPLEKLDASTAYLIRARPASRLMRGQRGRRGYSAETHRGDAAAATWIFRGDESRRRRGCDVDLPWRRAAAATWIFCGDESWPWPRRGYSVETSRGDAAAAT